MNGKPGYDDPPTILPASTSRPDRELELDTRNKRLLALLFVPPEGFKRINAPQPRRRR